MALNRLDPARRRAIVQSYRDLSPTGSKTDSILNYVKMNNARSISNFLDTASEGAIDQLERMLK